MKKLLVAIAVVASIGVTLSENNVMNLNAKFNALRNCCTDDEEAMEIAFTAYTEWGYTLGQAQAL